LSYQARAPRFANTIVALDLVSKGDIELDGMVTHKFPLDDFAEMIEVNLAKEKNQAVKTAVSFI
jgi:threonine dehydrogenase-like Zn-dependent dehydrogenase